MFGKLLLPALGISSADPQAAVVVELADQRSCRPTAAGRAVLRAWQRFAGDEQSVSGDDDVHVLVQSPEGPAVGARPRLIDCFIETQGHPLTQLAKRILVVLYFYDSHGSPVHMVL